MTPNAALLHNIRPLAKPTQVRLGDGRLIQACTQGDLHSRINVDNRELELCFPNVMHVPELGQNLLSSYVILKNGYRIAGNKDGFVVRQENGGAILLVRHTHNRLSYVPLLVDKPAVCIVGVTAATTVTSSSEASVVLSVEKIRALARRQACHHSALCRRPGDPHASRPTSRHEESARGTIPRQGSGGTGLHPRDRGHS